MARDRYVEHLQGNPLFAAMSTKEMGELLRRADTVYFEPGREVFAEGARGEEFWIVIDGTLQVSRNGQVVGTLGPGDAFGELAIIDPAPRDATVVCTSKAELLVIDRRVFWSVIDEFPAIAHNVMVGMARRLRSADHSGSSSL